MSYAELHAHSNFSFLDGASHPEELAAEAVRLGLSALALTDHNGLYGVVRFAEAARAFGLPTVFGAELTITGAPAPRRESPHRRARPRRHPPGGARPGPRGLRPPQPGHRRGPPGRWREGQAGHHPRRRWRTGTGGTGRCSPGAARGRWPPRSPPSGPAAAARALDHLIGRFGRDHLAVELWDHGNPVDATRNDALALLAIERGVAPVATNNVHYATPARFPLSHRPGRGPGPAHPRPISRGGSPRRPPPVCAGRPSSAGGSPGGPGWSTRPPSWPPPAPSTCVWWPPGSPTSRCRPGTPSRPGWSSWSAGAPPTGTGRGGPSGCRGPGPSSTANWPSSGRSGSPGYFLTVWDIVAFCRREDIFCQGRGSAATSAVCYALGITNVDAVSLGLLFERFLSPARDGPPDIDVDIESGRREEVIQYVYERYGRLHAAQVANVITYRSRSALRDVGKALGHPLEEVDTWSKSVDRGEPLHERRDLPPLVKDLAAELLDFPRHLGIHSGGMVICDRPVVEVCPVEWGRMPGRSVLQWDKDDCAAAGLVKFDLLGLGMLTALHHMVDLVREFHHVEDRPGPPRPGARASTTCCAGPTPSGCSRWSRGLR